LNTEIKYGTPEATVLVLDGHDGAGKTTLATRLAESLGGVHVRPFAESTGRQFTAYVDQGNLSGAADLARNGVEGMLSRFDGRVLVFDRHWMTAFSLLPECYWKAWQPLPPTTLCWANLETTLQRLRFRRRNEERCYDHRQFLSIYWKLAERFECNILRTDTLDLEDSVEALQLWAERFIK
jgi:adenylate kinase family enzyme